MITKEQVLNRLTIAVHGTDKLIYSEEFLDEFADYIAMSTNLTDGERIADELIDYSRNTQYAYRRCKVCGKLFRAGYVEGMGHAYYCSDECLHTKFTDEEWERECEEDS